jgi:hypothetical protein
MPIRINLLAEVLAAEEERRKDPVKLGTYVAAFLVALVVLWAAMLQLRIIGAKRQLNGIEAKWKGIEQGYQIAVDAQKKNIETEQKIAALYEMTTNRFLWGNLLNGFQQTLSGVQDVHVVRLRGDQSYVLAEGTPNRTNGAVITPGKPGTATEKIVVKIDARDVSPQGKRVNQFKESIAKAPFFKDNLSKTNGVLLTGRSAPQVDQANRQQFVTFTLECNLPEKTR